MLTFNENELITYYYENSGTQKLVYYSLNETLYAPTFPEEWAINHIDKTGPLHCNNCYSYGSWNGVFIGYCVNCAVYIYEGKRGYGMTSPGEEITKEYFEKNSTLNDEKKVNAISAFETYLHQIDLNKIGDKNICDSNKIKEEEEYDIILQEYERKEYEKQITVNDDE